MPRWILRRRTRYRHTSPTANMSNSRGHKGKPDIDWGKPMRNVYLGRVIAFEGPVVTEPRKVARCKLLEEAAEAFAEAQAIDEVEFDTDGECRPDRTDLADEVAKAKPGTVKQVSGNARLDGITHRNVFHITRNGLPTQPRGDDGETRIPCKAARPRTRRGRCSPPRRCSCPTPTHRRHGRRAARAKPTEGSGVPPPRRW